MSDIYLEEIGELDEIIADDFDPPPLPDFFGVGDIQQHDQSEDDDQKKLTVLSKKVVNDSDEDSSESFDFEIDSDEESAAFNNLEDSDKESNLLFDDSDSSDYEGGNEENKSSKKLQRQQNISLNKKSKASISYFKNNKKTLKETKRYTSKEFLKDITKILNAEFEDNISKQLEKLIYFDTKLERLIGIYEIIILLMQGILTPSLVKM